MKQHLFKIEPEQFLTIICKGRVLEINMEDLTHVSTYGTETIVYTPSHNYRTVHSLQEILNALPASRFFRIHRSHVISLKCMSGVSKNRIRVGDYYLPISKYYKLRLCNRLEILLNERCVFCALSRV